MELLVEWVMSTLVSIRLEMMLVLLQDRCTVCAKHTMAQKSFWTHQMVLLCNEGQVEARFGALGDSANLDIDRCTVCAKRTISSEIILDAPAGTPRCGHVKSRFDPFGHGVSVGAR